MLGLESLFIKKNNSLMDAASMTYSLRNEKVITGGREMIDGYGKIVVKQSGYGYEVGDMVWGKVRSHPWWPGQIFHEALALPCVSKTKREGLVLVAFFGDNSYGWFDPRELMPFEINYVHKSKQTNDREFVNAVKDAEDEIRRRAALGLSCQCWGTCNFQATDVKGLVEVDICGYRPGGVYSVKQIKNARDGFQPFEMLCFVKKLASMPLGNSERGINWIKNEAVVLAYRKYVFEEANETYVEAYGALPIHVENSIGTLNLQGQMPSKVRTFGKETTTLKKKSILEEISLTKPLVYRQADRVKNWDISRDFQQLQPKVSKAEKISQCLENVQVVGRTSPPSDSVLISKVIVTSRDNLDEKPRVLKCFGEDLHSEETLMINKKKRKRECKFELGLEYTHNHLKNGKRKLDSGACRTGSSDFLPSEKKIGFGRVNNVKHRKLLSCLSDIALNPFHNAPHNIPATMLQFFLGFRSFVYKKVLVAPATEAESIESSPIKSASCGLAAKSTYNGTAEDLPSALKPPKKRLTSDDFGNVGLNGSVINRGKQMSVEEPRRLNEVKALTEEKKAGNERMNVAVQTKLTEYSCKKCDTSARDTKLKMIAIRFPSQSALPSVSELKARFARFGQLHSPPRVIWKSSTCQILFKSKADAKAAYSYAVKNRSLFGSVKVEYFLQTLESSVTKSSRPGKQLVGKAPEEVPQVKPLSTGDQSTKPLSIAPQHQPMRLSVQPKSCLKKQLNDKITVVHNAKQLLAHNNIKNSDSNHSNGSSSSCATINTNAKNLQQVIPTSLLPHLSLPLSRISHMPENRKVNPLKVCKTQYLQPPEATNNAVYTSSNKSSQSIDISDEMLNLLIRCHEIVADLKWSLGYIPLSL